MALPPALHHDFVGPGLSQVEKHGERGSVGVGSDFVGSEAKFVFTDEGDDVSNMLEDRFAFYSRVSVLASYGVDSGFEVRAGVGQYAVD